MCSQEMYYATYPQHVAQFSTPMIGYAMAMFGLTNGLGTEALHLSPSILPRKKPSSRVFG